MHVPLCFQEAQEQGHPGALQEFRTAWFGLKLRPEDALEEVVAPFYKDEQGVERHLFTGPYC